MKTLTLPSALNSTNHFERCLLYIFNIDSMKDSRNLNAIDMYVFCYAAKELGYGILELSNVIHPATATISRYISSGEIICRQSTAQNNRILRLLEMTRL